MNLRGLYWGFVLGGLALAVAACGQSEAVPAAAHSSQAALGTVLTELERLQPPEGVDACVFAQLKAALGQALREHSTRLASAPPKGANNKVSDLVVLAGGGLRLMWSYRNIGDYNQDGVVSISDVTPLAIHYLATVAVPNSIEDVVDGNRDGVVNISDITPIAINFGVNCSGYALQNSPTGEPSGPGWSTYLTVPLGQAAGIGRLVFDLTAEPGEYEYYRVVPYDNENVLGEPSNAVHFAPQPPVVTAVDPLGGLTGTQITFSVSATGTPPLTYTWDFGGGAVPNQTTGAHPAVTLGAPGEYAASVQAANDYGQSDYPFTLTVTANPVEPPDIQSVTPISGSTGSVVIFTASVLGTPPFSYEWSFGGGADPNESTQEEPAVTLGLPGEYSANLTVTNSADSDDFPFTLTVTNGGHPGPVVVDPLGGNHPSLALVEGFPAIAYQRGVDPPDNNTPTCFFVLAADVDGRSWNAPAQAFPAGGSFPGSHNRLAVVGGHPAISTSVGFMIEGGAIRYARATDPTGSAWGSPVEVWNRGMVNPPPSGFTVVDGVPALAIPEDDFSGAGDLLYYRALDANGDSWPTEPVVAGLDVLKATPLSCDLALVGGAMLEPRPAILVSMYMEDTLFILASDEQGTSWETPIPIESMSDTSALCVVQGNPAVVWRIGGELPRMLFYMRADDEKGSEWTNKVLLDDWIISSGHLGFAVISGRPAVAYANGTWDSRRLYYTVADDEAGTNWCAPLEVHPGLNVTENVALLEVNGRPAIAYCEQGGTGNQLRFIRASDEYGYEWPE